MSGPARKNQRATPSSRRSWHLPPRNVEFVGLLETFLITAVTTILVIRTQLWLTHYPQLGGGGLHIAHLLWGGLFMVITIGVLLTFLGRTPRRPAAILGGVGFGFFIDELGKFITEDNNYFFRPAAGVIYAVFMVLFLIVAQLRVRGSRLSPEKRAANAIDVAVAAVQGRLDERELRLAMRLLDAADPTDRVVGRAARAARRSAGATRPASALLRALGSADERGLRPRRAQTGVPSHVFTFVETQFAAVFGRALDIVLLVCVRTLRHAEESLQARADDQAPAVSTADVLPPEHSVA